MSSEASFASTVRGYSTRSFSWLRARSFPMLSGIQASLLFVCSVFALALSFKPVLQDKMLFPNVDPLLFSLSFSTSRHFGSFLDLQTFAFGQAFGTFQYPVILHPFWWLFDMSRSVVLSCCFAVAVLFIGIVAYCRALGGSIYAGLLAGAIGCTVFFNPDYLVDFYGAVAPNCMAQIGIAYLSLACLHFGLRTPIMVVVGFVLLSWCILMDWLFANFLFPLIAMNLFVLSLSFLVKRKWLFHCLASLFIFLLYRAGIFNALSNFTLMSARLWGPSTYGGAPPYNVLPTSLLIFGGWPGLPNPKLFTVVGIGGIGFCVANWNWNRSAIALVVAMFLIPLGVLDWDAAGPNVHWTLPTMSYFERPLIPSYAVFAALMIVSAGYWLFKLVDGSNKWLTFFAQRLLRKVSNGKVVPLSAAHSLLTVCFAVPAAFALLVVASTPGDAKFETQLRRVPWYWYSATSFVKSLGLTPKPGETFSPYFFDATEGGKVNNCSALGNYTSFNMICGSMMEILLLPNFSYFHNLADLQNLPMIDQLYKVVLADSQRHGSYVNLKAFGIRYLALDGDVAGARRIAVGDQLISLVDLGPIMPVEISAKSANYIGHYNTGEVVAARLSDAVVVHNWKPEGAPTALTPLDKVTFTIGPGWFEVSGESAENSILLLPFQFSNCLSVETLNGSGRLVRANGAQAGLYIRQHAVVRIHNNLKLFGDTNCRERDFEDVTKIGLWSRSTYKDITGGRRVPLLMRLVLERRIRRRDSIPLVQ